MVMLVGVCERNDGNAPWNPLAIAGALAVIVPFSLLMCGMAAASCVNDIAWGDQTNNPNFGKR